MTALKVRMRPDLVLAAHGEALNRYWVVQDPVTLNYFRLRDEECSILRMLDGRQTLEEIRQRFERQFAPLRLGVDQLQAFLFRLHEFGLIVGDVAGQGAVLSERRTNQRQRSLLNSAANPLAIRLPGLAARPIVEWLYPRCRWLFSPGVLAVCGPLILWAGMLVAAQFASFQARLPGFGEFFSARAAVWFVVLLVIIKALHELGHALMCRHFGGACREFGVLLLVGMPTLYCDVSDAWRLESKWQRILISSAGMLVELVIASIATLLWWFSGPGLLNSLCLRVMFLCSVSTVLFNANPLLRCDGYYILSDLLGVPNLGPESQNLWSRGVWSWLTGVEQPSDPTISRRLEPWLLLYAALALLYRWALVAGILWFCFKVLEPHGLISAAWLLAGLVLMGLVVPPLRTLLTIFSNVSYRRQIRRGRAAVALVASLLVLVVVMLVPLPHRIRAPLWIEAADAKAVYVSVPGTLASAIGPGTSVAAGQTLGKLISAEVELQVAALMAEVQRKETHLKNLRLILSDDPSVAPLIPAEEKSLEDTRGQLAQWQRDQQRLVLQAPVGGTVLPPPVQKTSPSGSKRLLSWQGTPLDPQNRGCFLDTGALVCLVGNPSDLQATLVVEQADVPFLRDGQAVRLRIDQGPVVAVTGKIADIAKADADEIPGPLARALDLPLKQNGEAAVHTAETYYQARLTLEPHQAPLLIGMHGQAKISAPWEPLAWRFWRYLQRTFQLA